MSFNARADTFSTSQTLASTKEDINAVEPVTENESAKRKRMPKSPWSQVRQATPEILVITRRGIRRITAWRRPLARLGSQYLPEGLAVVGVVLVVLATWIIHPIAGLYVAGGAGLGAGWLIALGRRPPS